MRVVRDSHVHATADGDVTMRTVGACICAHLLVPQCNVFSSCDPGCCRDNRLVCDAWTNDLESDSNGSTDLSRGGEEGRTSWARCSAYHCPRSTQGQGVVMLNNKKITHVSGMWGTHAGLVAV
jgi:hypothetical protein